MHSQEIHLSKQSLQRPLQHSLITIVKLYDNYLEITSKSKIPIFIKANNENKFYVFRYQQKRCLYFSEIPKTLKITKVVQHE